MFRLKVIDVLGKDCANGQGKVPFVSIENGYKWIHFIPFEEYMPKQYIHNKKLWKLNTGNGSTYYTLERKQILPILKDGPFELEGLE